MYPYFHADKFNYKISFKANTAFPNLAANSACMKTTFISLLIVFLFSVTIVSAQQKSGYKKPDYDSLQNSYTGLTYVPIDVTSLDGRHITNASLKGKITWLNFWFEACPGCRNEFEKLNKLYDSLKNDPDFQFIAITYDRKETLLPFIKQFNLHYPIATVNSQVETDRLSYTHGYPTNIVIGKDGKVALVRWWLMEREAKYGITLQDAYKLIEQLKAAK